MAHTPAAMKRTTIMLPEDLRRRALHCAKQKGLSLGELIRDSLSAALPAVRYDALADRLFEGVVFDGPAPAVVPGVDLSDHRSFWQRGDPAVMITDTAFYRNPRYHTKGDTPETLDYRRMAEVVAGVRQAVLDLAR